MTPGQEFSYSNVGFDLAALAVERITERSFEAFLRERFFVPLGMTDSFIRPARLSSFAGVRTRGYRRSGTASSSSTRSTSRGSTAAATCTRPRRTSRAGTRRGSGVLRCRRPVLEAGLRPATLGEGESGLTLLNLYRSPDGMRFWYHGHWQGFHDTIWRDLARERSIVFVSNNTIGSDLQSGLVPAVVALLDGQVPPPPPAWTPLRDADLPAVTGAWTVPGIGNVEIALREGGLLLRHVTGVRYALFRVEPAVFYAPGLEVWLGFDRDARGRVSGLVWRTLMGDVEGTRSAASRPLSRARP